MVIGIERHNTCSPHSLQRAPTVVLYIVMIFSAFTANGRMVRNKRAFIRDSPAAEHVEEQEGRSGEPTRATQVKLLYGVTTDHKGLITCEVTTHYESGEQPTDSWRTDMDRQSSSAVYLICPQVSTSICYMDCTPSCVLNEHGCGTPRSISDVIEHCSYHRINTTRLLVNYVINLRALNRTGKWDCDYRGQRTMQPLELRAAEHRVFNKTPSLLGQNNVTDKRLESSVGPRSAAEHQTSSSKHQQVNNAKAPQVHTTSKNIVRESEEVVRPPLDPTKRTLQEFNIKLTRPELVVILLSVLSMSLLANVVLIVRCVLLKAYLENTSDGKMSSCLSHLLCLPRKRNNKSTCSTPLDSYTNHKPLTSRITTDFRHYSTSPDGRSSDSYGNPHNALGLNSTIFNGLHFYGTDGYTASDAKIYPHANPIVSDETVGSASSGPYSRVHRAPFYDDLREPNAPVSTGPITFIPMNPHFPRHEHQFNGPEGAINDSLTGSLILTNDSGSCAEAHADINGNPRSTISPEANLQSFYSASIKHSHTDHRISERAHARDEMPLGQSANENHEVGNLQSPLSSRYTATRPNAPMVQSAVFEAVSTDSVQLHDPSRKARYQHPTMTPLVVRFPSGEAGLLICPNRTGEMTFDTGSLKRHPLHKTGANLNRSRCKQTKQIRQRRIINKSLGTTDTESDSGCTDYAFIDVSSKDLSDRSRQNEAALTHCAKFPKSPGLCRAKFTKPVVTSALAKTAQHDSQPDSFALTIQTTMKNLHENDSEISTRSSRTDGMGGELEDNHELALSKPITSTGCSVYNGRTADVTPDEDK